KEIAQLDEKDKQESQKSYQKGIKEGVKQAQHQFQSQVNQTLKIFNQLLDSISSQTDKIKEDQQQELLDFIISIARKVIDTELEINPNIILNVLKNALNLINEREEIRILVNPKDWLTVKENLKNLNVQFELPKQIEVINANEISPGGCRIEFSSGSIDADIETQFQEIRRKLLKNAE
ncbi:MAG: FliH/SctL family protein, partial [Candidatus Cloacimonetes bacterium]|nr:FliH/SctL family protein [Candidatus Cloacimonadota bacterium]